jgi:hypothetical protein
LLSKTSEAGSGVVAGDCPWDQSPSNILYGAAIETFLVAKDKRTFGRFSEIVPRAFEVNRLGIQFPGLYDSIPGDFGRREHLRDKY